MDHQLQAAIGMCQYLTLPPIGVVDRGVPALAVSTPVFLHHVMSAFPQDLLPSDN